MDFDGCVVVVGWVGQSTAAAGSAAATRGAQLAPAGPVWGFCRAIKSTNTRGEIQGRIKPCCKDHL